MTRTPDGSAKAAAENEDAVTNAARKPRGQRTAKEQEKVSKAVESEPSKDTDARARKTTSGAAAEGEPLPKAEPEAVSKPGDEQRPAESDNATPTGVERPDNDPEKHPASTAAPFSEADDDDDDDAEEGTNTSTEFDGSASVPENTSSPLGLDPSTEGKADKMKDRNIADLEEGMPTAEELPVPQTNPNAAVPEGEVEVTRKAKKGEQGDPGGNFTERAKTGRQRAPKKDVLKDIEDLSQLPIAVAVGQVTASVEEYAGRAVLSLSLRGWVGDAPLKIRASDIGDLEQAISELRAQLS